MDNYFYSPIAYYAGKVLKCQGIATESNTAWFLAANPGTVVLEGYRGDRIREADHSQVKGG
jgi:hypothetical protein